MKKTLLVLMMVMFVTSGGQAALVGHWKLDVGSDPNFAVSQIDSPASDGALGTLARWVTEDLGPVPSGTTSAVAFDAQSGNNDAMITTGFAGVSGDSARTVCAWIKADATQTENAAIVSWGSTANGTRYTFRLNLNAGNGTVGALRLEVAGGYVTKSIVVNDGKWHHVAVSHPAAARVNEKVIEFYVDGQLDPQTTGNGSNNRPINTGTNNSVTISGSLHAEPYNFDGVIDEVMIFDEKLETSAIQELAGAPKILVQPQNAVLSALGGDVSLTVETENPESLTFQWYRGLVGDLSNKIEGATESTYIVTVDDYAVEGSYFCQISNGTLTVNSNTANILVERLVANWNFENNFADSEGDHDLTAAAGLKFVQGIDGQAVDCNSVSGYAQYEFGTMQNWFSGYTVSLWTKTVNPLQANYSAIFNVDGFQIDTNGAGSFRYHNNTDGLFGLIPTDPTAWAHLAMICDGKDTTLYMNGQKIRTIANESQPLFDNFGIGGNRSFTTLYNGSIDDVRVWNYPLDQLEIGGLYAKMTGEGVCVEYAPIDFDLDCQIDFDDIAIFASQWLDTYRVTASE